ncbi:MAG: SHOCT domain-containing protein [Thermincola sp.]|jgi:putative membrane protein|nr:SHOCT domain-containing protein [Thermincola sp.]MDT3702834.1 SHOCT domain-containing protein [Thermincola sp.]
MMMGPWFYGAGGSGWFGMGLGMVFQLLFWILIIYVVVRLVRGGSVGRATDDGSLNFTANNRSSAKEILKQRYAKGEITREQFKEMLDDIKE